MRATTVDDVVAFVAQNCGVATQAVSRDTRLQVDLGVDGADAAELMEEFANRFRVDLSEFEFDRHFSPEAGFNPIVWLYYRLVKPQALRFESVSVHDLVDAARNGKWEYGQRYDPACSGRGP